jgi:hypothetical protein
VFDTTSLNMTYECLNVYEFKYECNYELTYGSRSIIFNITFIMRLIREHG